MKNDNMTMIAEAAISLLKQDISNKNKNMVLQSYESIENESFSWDGLDVLFMEWYELVDESNDILYG